ncbi:hypothetical protein CIW48_28150 [Methylobacterium sp. P1-11]|uniref:hypothetical protein n=1 Tax=Methylobacterium sp. P1-11 TaxID=2024616 RepID=UPI0011EE0088|nr:hypothetical protein [Methylobacterium sp. P1-11]KAA0115651.1 hypothetical protein CIW48_28150 [Methylobacterium sp. P1-11]
MGWGTEDAPNPRLVGVNHFALEASDPLGNHIKVIRYADVQFTEALEVQAGMGHTQDGSEQARGQLAEKGMCADAETWRPPTT